MATLPRAAPSSVGTARRRNRENVVFVGNRYKNARLARQGQRVLPTALVLSTTRIPARPWPRS